MSQTLQADIVIVGAGMVGLTLAAALAPSGANIVLLERRPGDPAALGDAVQRMQQAQPERFDPRVSALTCASQQILSAVGAWQGMERLRLSPYTGMDVWDGEGSGRIQFDCHELHEPCLGHIVENRVILAGLCQALLSHPNIRLLDGVEVDRLSPPQPGGRELVLDDGRRLQSPLVVAADGASSRTRQLAGIPMWEWDYGHHAIVTTVRTARSHQQTAWQRFTGDGPLAFLPLCCASDPQHYCSIVWSTSPAHAKALMALEDDAFGAALAQAFEQRLGAVEWCDRRHLLPLRQRHAQYYVQAGFAAVGDAAHTIHPLAGQGVNLGLLDAAALAETLLDARARQESWGSERVLRRFQRARHGDNLRMSAAMEGFKRLFDQQPPALRLARSLGMSLLDRLAPVKNHIVLQAMGLRGPLPRLARRPLA